MSLPTDVGALDQQVDVVAASGASGATGVSVRVYLPPTADTPGQPSPRLAALARNGVEIRACPRLVPRMAIIDRRLVVMARNQADYGDGALIGRDLPFTSMLVSTLTSTAAEDADDPSDGEEITPLSREVLRQLSRGVKDEVAARELGMALRTYRRAVARLMELLHADSRFQAGYLAAQRHWL
ncbi:hypothetical protein ACFYZ2_37695 [Streptomyces sviceus]|uniref:helix-turn-helix transcriptional regulator n=1 Tax=Streptomyces sviceus TaxID=285530 RepID=UPI0036993253